jgi:hypothetical protein
LKAKANMRVSSDIEGLVPLMMATSLEMVQLLCEAQGSNIHATDWLKRSVPGYYVGVGALNRYVTSIQASRILEYLINRGADLYAKSNAKMSLVDFAACKMNADEPLKFLLQRDPKLIDKQADEWTSLHWACRQGNLQAAKVLLEHGSQMKKVTTSKPPQSWTPYDILRHYRTFPRDFDESTTYALGRPEEFGISLDIPPGEQIDYSSLEITESRRKPECTLCAMSVYVRVLCYLPPSSYHERDQC